MLVVVTLPMMVSGAILGLSTHDRYLVYEVCGRFLPISAVTDQQLGGLVIWIAGGITIGTVFIVVLARMLANEKRAQRAMGPRVAKAVLTK